MKLTWPRVGIVVNLFGLVASACLAATDAEWRGLWCVVAAINAYGASIGIIRWRIDGDEL